jgi:hypothetical protein
MQQQQLESRMHLLRLDEDNYYAIKQLTVQLGYKFPASLINHILKEYIEAHKDLILTEKQRLHNGF